jgi:ferric-dicitrate binding protein FerR (iron transport regulator)
MQLKLGGSGSLSLRVAVGVAVLAASITALILGRRPPPVAAHTIEARLELAAGDVLLKHGAAWETVISGLPLPDGAELSTGKGARALVRLSDGSAVFLRGDSAVQLQRTGIELQSGEMWLDAPASDRGALAHKLGDVTVSAADAGLSLKRDGAAVTVYVARGLAVVMAPGGRVEVNAGEQAAVGAGAPPKVTPVKYWEDWTGGMGDHGPVAGGGAGAGRIYGIDRSALPGTPARTLEISRQAVRAVIRDGLAETEVDQTFGNPGGREVEGWYWFTVPEHAIVTSFAVETDGALVEGEVIEQKEAAAKYQAAVRAAHEPALLEWIDGRSYRARIFPVPASGSRRVVLRYLEMVSARSGKLEYVYPLRGAGEPVTIGELSLSVDLGSAGAGAAISTLADAVIEDGGRLVTMRRSGYTPRADFQVEAEIKQQAAPFRVSRYSAGRDLADYVMARYTPDIDWGKLKEQPGDLVVVVDTSASADDAARAQKSAAAEAVLRALSPQDHFALVALDTQPTVLHPKEGLAAAESKEIAVALERLAEHRSGGATDLGALFDVALGRVHGKEQPAVIYIGDGLATSGEIAGDKLTERLRRSLSTSRARFFTVAVGAEANHPLLRELSRAGGGQMFRIDDNEGASAEVLRLASAVKTPTITDLSIDLGAGLDEPMITASGKVSRGEEVVLLARTHHPLPEKATVKGRVGGKPFEQVYPIAADPGVGAALVPRLWAAEKVRRLLGQAADPDEHHGKVVELGLDYGLVTPFTSILALESEQAYVQQGIRRRFSPLRGVKLTALTPSEERHVIDLMAPASPVVAMGCSRDEPAGAAVGERASRAKAEEGRMGAPAQAPMAAATAAAAAELPDQTAQNALADGPAAHDAKTYKKRDVSDEEKPAEPAAPAPPPPPPAIAGGKGGAGAPALPGRAAMAARPMNKDANGLENPFGAPKPAPAPPHVAQNQPAREAAKQVAPPKPQPPRPPVPAQCSDSSKRPLAERIVLWRNRLKRASSAAELIARYDGALATCELDSFRAKAAMLSLIQAKVRTEGAAEQLLARFAGERETQKLIAQAILRRSVDPRIVAVVRRALFEDKVKWAEIDNELAALATPEDRVAKLRQLLLGDEGDPEVEMRLVRALAEAKQKDEALALGRRLRDRGLMSPSLSLALGDVLAASGETDEAVRAYSEIVEFDPASADSRRLLGDVYLRHGWYPAAYRQYKTLTDVAATEPTSWLRLAAAAAGSGRVDEALRLERQVATAEGTPGPNDPRAWARMLSAARLGRLLAEPGAPASQAESVSRKLKELGVFAGPAALMIVTWEDYGAGLSLVPLDGDKETTVGETTSAIPVGLASVLMPAADADRLQWVVRWKNDPPGRDVAFVVQTITWDGKAFKVKVQQATLAAKEKESTL